ncbi:MAG: oligosaccharide flippase family protein [Crocinitomicaceae bacterium]|nr:oligosaccharide flippase family protein [Crocinitomicaceae bacterium]
MLKSFVKNSSIYLVSGVLTKGISFFLLPLYTSILTQNDYGSLAAISIISTIVIMAFSFQINEGVARYYNELKDQESIQIYTSSVAYFCLLTFAIFLGLSFLFNTTLSTFYGVDGETTKWASLSIFLNALFYFSQNQLTWKLKPTQEAISALSYNLSAILLSIVLLVQYDFGVKGIMIAQCIASVIGIICALFFTYNDFKFKFSFKVIIKLLSFSMPLIPRALSIFLFLYTDQFCVKQILGLKEFGVFSVGIKIASILVIVNLGFAAAISPLIYKHYKEKDTPIKIGVIFRYFCFLSVLVISGLSFFAEPIILIFTEGNYSSAAICVPFLATSIFFSSILQFFPGLVLSKKTWLLSVITGFCCVLNLILNLLFVPDYGILGSAIVTSTCFSINFYFIYHYSQKEYWVDASLYSIFGILVIFFSLMLISSVFNLSIYSKVFFFVITTIFGYFLLLRKTDKSFIMKNYFKD